MIFIICADIVIQIHNIYLIDNKIINPPNFQLQLYSTQ